MERRGLPLSLLLDACSFIFRSALDMAGGPGSPASPTLPFKGGVEGDRGKGTWSGGAAASAVGGGDQEGWEAFNRSMDDRDDEVLKAAAATAAAASADKKAGERELPATMVEVLKVSLSLLRRLANRNLTTAGPFASAMQMWPPGHPQVL